MGLIENFYLRTLAFIIRQGGRTVSREHKKERKQICSACPHLTKVKVKPYLPEVAGCGICKCPIETKSSLYSIRRVKDKEGTPLTGEELAMLVFFEKEKTTSEIVTCPNEEVNFWLEVDQKYHY